MTPDTVQTPGDLVLSYDASGLSDGLYEDTLSLSSAAVGLNPVKELIRLRVSSQLIAN